MVAVRCGSDRGVVVGDVLGRQKVRPVCQNDVIVTSEAFFDKGQRRDHDDLARAVAEGEDVTVFFCEAAEETVYRRFHEVEVADDGKRSWSWWEIETLRFG